jgi:hypothetical protein
VTDLGQEDILKSSRLFQELLVLRSITDQKVLQGAAVRSVCHFVLGGGYRKREASNVK